MGILVDAKKRNADTKSTSEPADKFHGKVWYDYNEDTMKIWNANTGSWLNESQITIDLVDATA